MPAKKDVPPKSELINLYLTQKKNLRNIGNIYDVNKSTVKKWLVRCNIPIRSTGYGLDHRGEIAPTKDELYDMIYIQGLLYREIAEKYKVHESAIGHWLDKHGIDRPGGKKRGLINTLTKDILSNLYENQGYSLTAIGGMYDASEAVISRLCNEFEIETRPEGWAAKSFQCKDGHIVKSTYELKVDNWLYTNHINHIYEPLLPFGRQMKADFLANGWYIEIWGVVNDSGYKKRKRRKVHAYSVNNMPLIEIPVHAFDTHHNNQWKRILQKCLQTTTLSLLRQPTL